MSAERLPAQSPEDHKPSICPFEVGKAFTKIDIYRIFEVPEQRQKGNWNTGYTKYAGRWFIFSNVGTAGRTGHDYGDHFRGDRLVWFGKTDSHVGQASIAEMVSGTRDVFIFYRRQSRSPYTFAGLGRARAVKDATPVEVEWEIIAARYAPLPLLIATPPPSGQREVPTLDDAAAGETSLPGRDHQTAIGDARQHQDQVVAVPVPGWVEQLLAHQSFQQATTQAGRHRPSNALLAQLLAALDAAPGRQLPLPALARAVACAPIRMGGILAQASRLLNIDGYPVLKFSGDRGFVRLDRDLAIRQFLPGSRP